MHSKGQIPDYQNRIQDVHYWCLTGRGKIRPWQEEDMNGFGPSLTTLLDYVRYV